MVTSIALITPSFLGRLERAETAIPGIIIYLHLFRPGKSLNPLGLTNYL